MALNIQEGNRVWIPRKRGHRTLATASIVEGGRVFATWEEAGMTMYKWVQLSSCHPGGLI